MNNQLIILGASLLLFVPSLANAEIPKHPARDSQVLPYLLENPNNDSLVRVRCVSSHKQEVNRQRAAIRDYLLQQHETSDTVTIEITGSCRDVKIRVQNDDYPVYNPDLDEYQSNFDDYWLTRKGSGWYWLLRHR
jgi:hypothetical protein